MNMKQIIFIPLGKTFNFRLTENTCSRCKTGSCPLDYLSILDIEDFIYSGEYIRRGTPEYCVELAKKHINHSLNAANNIQIYYHTGCNHYDFNDGQHRTCVAARLMLKGIKIDLPVSLYKVKGKCLFCRYKERQLRYKDYLFQHIIQVNADSQSTNDNNNGGGFLYTFNKKDEMK